MPAPTTPAAYSKRIRVISLSLLLLINIVNLYDRHVPGAGRAHALGVPAFRATGLQQALLVIPVLALALGLVRVEGSRSIVEDIPAAGNNLRPAESTGRF